MSLSDYSYDEKGYNIWNTPQNSFQVNRQYNHSRQINQKCVVKTQIARLLNGERRETSLPHASCKLAMLVYSSCDVGRSYARAVLWVTLPPNACRVNEIGPLRLCAQPTLCSDQKDMMRHYNGWLHYQQMRELPRRLCLQWGRRDKPMTT